MLKVVVVEDEEFVRKGIVLTVDWNALDCEIVGEASDGKAGLELIRQTKPDIIIIDIKMPYMTGIEMLTELRNEGNNVQAVILTAYSDFSYAQQAIKLKAVDYLLKPFHDDELEAVIKKIANQLKSENKNNTSQIDFSNKAPLFNRENPERQMLPAEEEIKKAIQKIHTTQSKYIKEVVLFIYQNYSNPDLGISLIADNLKSSQSHLSHSFKNETGYTLTDYITKYRLHKAMELLVDCRNRVSEVSLAVGYRDFAYFSSLFKKSIGVSPSEFQGK